MTSDLAVFIILQFDENPVNGNLVANMPKNGRSAGIGN
jgi:hypothetical protein